MIVLGLTGGIACGKSTVLRMFAREGASVYDADKAAHTLLASDQKVAVAIHAAFPSIPATLPIDRKALGKLIFGHDVKMKTLESILHPRVRVMEKQFLRRALLEGRGVAVCDIPLLFETGAEHRYDAVITVSCPAFLQEQRAMSRPGMTAERYRDVTHRQMPAYEKLRRSDFTVHTGLGLAYSYREVVEILKKLGAR